MGRQPLGRAVPSHSGLTCLCAALAAGACVTASARASEPPDAAAADPSPRPAYQNLRFKEDWSVLRGRDPVDFWDPIKYIPLTEDGEVYLSFGGQYRARVEHFTNFAFGAPDPSSDTYFLSRLRLHGDLHIGEAFRVFVEGRSSLATDRDLPGGRRTVDVDEIDLQNAFFDVRLPIAEEVSLTVRPGRQEMQFGRQRLVSPLDWANVRRSFDGVRATLRAGDWSIDGFWSQLVDVRKYEFNIPDPGVDFYGMYAAGKLPGGIGLDVYWLGLDRRDASFGGVAGREDRQTLGTRFSGDIGNTGIDYDLEGAYQFGDHAGRPITAGMAAGTIGRTFADAPWSPRLEVGAGYASGGANESRVRTFNQLFPLGHAYLGFADVVGRQNVIDVSAGFALHPVERLMVRIDGHAFWRASQDDALYNVAGGVLRSGDLGSSREIGQEIDVTVRYRMGAHSVILAGYSRFFAGKFIRESGESKDIDFLYISVEYTF